MNSPRETFGFENSDRNNEWIRAIKTSPDRPREIPDKRKGFGPDDYECSEKDLEMIAVDLQKRADESGKSELLVSVLALTNKTRESIKQLRTKSRESGGMTIEEERLLLPGETVLDPYKIDDEAYENKKVEEKINLQMKFYKRSLDSSFRMVDTEKNLGLYKQLEKNEKTIKVQPMLKKMLELSK